MKYFAQMQLGLLALLAVEGAALLMQGTAERQSVSPLSECRYDEATIGIDETGEAKTIDEVLGKHAALKKQVGDIITQAGATYRLKYDTAGANFQADDSMVGVEKAIPFMDKPESALMVNGSLSFTIEPKEKAADVMKQLVAANITSDLRFEKGDTCDTKKAEPEPVKKDKP